MQAVRNTIKQIILFLNKHIAKQKKKIWKLKGTLKKLTKCLGDDGCVKRIIEEKWNDREVTLVVMWGGKGFEGEEGKENICWNRKCICWFGRGCNGFDRLTSLNTIYLCSSPVLHLTTKLLLKAFIWGSDADHGFFDVILQRVDE